jgi:hypothetical protein
MATRSEKIFLNVLVTTHGACLPLKHALRAAKGEPQTRDGLVAVPEQAQARHPLLLLPPEHVRDPAVRAGQQPKSAERT